MRKFEDILLEVNQYIDSIEYNRSPKELYEPIKYTLQLGGKRIRPVIMLMAYSLYEDDIERILPQAAAIEVFHNFTLLHDDVMDRAEIRRGKPTVHKLWNDNVAILSGDAMVLMAYDFMCKCTPYLLSRILPLFNLTNLEVCEGQQMDMDFESRRDVTAEEYLQMIRLKTAVLLACSLKMGAVMGGADTEDANNMYDFGINLGLAFQLQDDLLDVYGDVDKFGKSIGGDIACNKKTFMLIKALECSKGDLKKELEELIYNCRVDKEEKIKAVTDIYNRLGIKEICIEKMNEYYAEAMKCLGRVKVDDEKKNELKKLAQELMNREK